MNAWASRHGTQHAAKHVFGQWYSDIATQLFQQGDITNAEQAFRNALLIDPVSMGVRIAVGCLHGCTHGSRLLGTLGFFLCPSLVGLRS